MSDGHSEDFDAEAQQVGIVQTVPTQKSCGGCGRFLYADDLCLSVETAIDKTKSSPAHDDLSSMRSSSKSAIRDRYYDLEDRFEQYSAYGKLEVPREMREIPQGLWEIKTAQDRVPFYAVKATGDHRRSIRLLSVFQKKKGKTAEGKIPRNQVDRAVWVREGDKKHG